jgi:hypothetical protein
MDLFCLDINQLIALSIGKLYVEISILYTQIYVGM